MFREKKGVFTYICLMNNIFNYPTLILQVLESSGNPIQQQALSEAFR